MVLSQHHWVVLLLVPLNQPIQKIYGKIEMSRSLPCAQDESYDESRDESHDEPCDESSDESHDVSPDESYSKLGAIGSYLHGLKSFWQVFFHFKGPEWISPGRLPIFPS